MIKVKKSKLAIVDLYKESCNMLAELVNKQLFDGCRKWYWIGDDVGGVCDFDSYDVLNADDMVRIIEHGMTYDDYEEWRDANIDNKRYINLRSWLMGLRHDMLKEEVKENVKP